MGIGVKTLVLIFLISFDCLTIEQTECTVLLESISKDYQGDCRKGLAHGEGVAIGRDTYKGEFRKGLPHGNGKYTYLNGSEFTGSWMHGKKDGYGKMKFVTPSGDSILTGYWKGDRYIGKENLPAYSVNRRYNIDRYLIRKILGENQDKIVIKTQSQNGLSNRIDNFQIIQSSGIFQQNRSYTIINSIDFPFEGTVTYTTPNKTNSMIINVAFNFKINEPGSWEIILFN